MGCAALLVFAALALYVLAGPGTGVDGLPAGFLVGLVAGALLALLGTFDWGWNSHVEHVRRRDRARADQNADNDRR